MLSGVAAQSFQHRDPSGVVARHTRRRESAPASHSSPLNRALEDFLPRAVLSNSGHRAPSSFQNSRKLARGDEAFVSRMSRIRGSTLSRFKNFLNQPLLFVMGVMLMAAFITAYLDLLKWPEMFPSDSPNSLDFLPRIQSLEEKVDRATKALQVQVDIIRLKSSELEQHQNVMKEDYDATGRKFEKEISDLKGVIEQLDEKFIKLIDDAGPMIQKEILELTKSLIKERDRETSGSVLSLEDVRAAAKQMIESELRKHSADVIGLPDFALSSAGGRVVTHSEPFVSKVGGAGFQILKGGITPGFLAGNFRLHPMASSILSPRNGAPGNCLPLKGNNGSVGISLRAMILPDAVSIDHIDKRVAFDISSAPKDFQVFGAYFNHNAIRHLFEKETPPMMLLGRFRYTLDSSPVQTFHLSEYSKGKPVNYISLKLLSNHGNPDFTCIYRFRVHGRPLPPGHIPDVHYSVVQERSD